MALNINKTEKINFTNLDKMLWPDIGVKKIDYFQILAQLSPYIIPHTSDRILTIIRYPNNIHNESFYQKRIPAYAPKWIDRLSYGNSEYINLNKLSTLLWLANSSALEFHVGFNKLNENLISYLVFDLDPSEGQCFEQVAEAALTINEELNKLNLVCHAKTSGASGLQLYIPIKKIYTYEQGRQFNTFFAQYFSEKYPKLITIERSVKKRGALLYFDYLQMWKGKTIISVYSPRAVKSGAVSTPITWEELDKGNVPSDYHLLNIFDRIKSKGDLFKSFLDQKRVYQDLEFIVKHLKSKHYSFLNKTP